jgi:hypothetical protein
MARKAVKNHTIDRRAGKLAVMLENGGAPDEVFSTGALAETIDVSPQWLEIGRLASYDYGPPFVRYSPTNVGYRRRDVVKWLRERAAVYAAKHPAPQVEPQKMITVIRTATVRP